MPTTINGVNFDEVVQDAIEAGIAAFREDASGLRDIIENIAKGLVNDVAFLARKKASGEFDEDDARIFMEDQKTVAGIKLKSLAIIGLQTAERVWNAIVGVFRTAIKTALGGWSIV